MTQTAQIVQETKKHEEMEGWDDEKARLQEVRRS